MLATGGLLVAIAVLTLAAVAPLFRRDDPPRWTTRGWIGELVTLAIVCTLAIGLGYLGAGAIAATQTGPEYLDLGLLVVVLFVSVVIWRRLGVRTPAQAVEADASASAPVSAPAQAHRARRPVTTAEPLPGRASVPPPPHKAA